MEIELWQTLSGRSPVLEFINSQPPRAKQRIMKSVDHLQEQGIALLVNKRKFEKITGYTHLYELKMNFQGVAYRIICSVKNNVAKLLTAFKKKDQKTRMQNIKLAIERSNS